MDFQTTIDTFKLRFFDNDIHPDSFTNKELGRLIINLEESVKAIIESNYPESNPELARICLIGIEDKSESLLFKIIDDQPVEIASAPKAIVDFGRAIGDGTYTNLPDRAFHGAKHIVGIVQEKECKSELIYKDKQVFEINPDIELIKPENVSTFIDTSVYGTILKIGGEKPKIWLLLGDDRILNFSITVEQARELSPNLYKSVGLKGKAKWNIATEAIIGFKLYDILGYKSGNTSNAINALRGLTGGHWDLFNSDDEINNFLRKD